jgi:RNA polymerase sigma-70 factor, ECF subfamily
MTVSDEQLLEAYRRGREDAFDALVRRYGPSIKGFAYRLLHSQGEAEEVYAETFLRVAKARGKWESRGTVRAWLYTIARRLAYDILRHRAITRREEGTVVEIERWRGVMPSPEARAQLGQAADRLERALGQLSEEHREVLLLRTVHGLDAHEVAQALGTTEEQVHSRLSYARKKLREQLVGANRISLGGA